jgi:hypothetical protein
MRKETKAGVYYVHLTREEGKAEGVHFFKGKRGLIVTNDGQRCERLAEWLKKRKAR